MSTTDPEEEGHHSAVSNNLDASLSGPRDDQSQETESTNLEEPVVLQPASNEESKAEYDVEPTNDSAFRMGSEIHLDPAVITSLSNGFAQNVLPTLSKSQAIIGEIVSNQIVLIETLEQENNKFKDCSAFSHLSATMIKARDYYNRLIAIRKDMTQLHDRAAKLKKRALKLQQQKQKEELQRAHEYEKELEKDHMLTARVANPDT